MNRVRIVFPEMENEIIREAIERTQSGQRGGGTNEDRAEGGLDGRSEDVAESVADAVEVEALEAGNLEEACRMVASGVAEGMIAGIDYTSREMILACKEIIGVKEVFAGINTESSDATKAAGPTKPTFSASFVLTKCDKCYVIGDAAACKNPTEAQLYDIVLQTYNTALAVLEEEPKVAILSFSTFGSGGKDPSMDKARAVIERVRATMPEIQIDGEMQLDTAVNLRVAEKKAPGSHVAGRANVLILPDLNSGNILYKAMEQFGGFTAAGPILQGFKAPCSDLSRGSTVEDVMAVIEVIKRQILMGRAEKRNAEKVATR